MPASVHLRRVTLLLVAVSTALVQVALHDRESGLGLPLLAVSLMLAVGLRWLPRLGADRPRSFNAVGGILAIALLPIVWDIVTRATLNLGNPYEVQLAYVLRNAMIALAATPGLPRATGHATLASFFLVVLGYLWSSGPLAITLLVIYALLGTWWLLAGYWERLGGRFADSSESAIPVRPAMLAFVAIGVAGLLLLPLASRSGVTTALDGFFPSSGGTRWGDPFAHGGVGDGPQMVAAKEEASSFGPVESELFLESKMPSLYDAFNEFSEAPPLKQKRLRRSIPLAPSQVQINHEKRATTQQARREFSTVRRTKRRGARPKDLPSAAMLLVKGRTPLHLGLEAYDQWDGARLTTSGVGRQLHTHLRNSPDATGRRWLDLSLLHPTDAYSATERSQVRVVNLKTDRVPTPAGTTRVTMQGLHAASMFKFTEDGCLAMDVQHVPQLTIFEFASSVRQRDSVLQLHQAATDGVKTDDANPAIADIAEEWTRHVSPGWPQVDAIVTRLRTEYAHDREAMVPEDADDAVEYFLTEAKRGPDYLFATSAAVLMRSLGFETRVMSGFYADPTRHNRSARMTPVLIEDAHFWTEVRTSNGNRTTEEGKLLPGVWATLEPTPGYDLLYAPETLVAWLRRHALATIASITARPVLATLSIAVLAAAFAYRRPVLDGLLIGLWTIRSRTTEVGRLAQMTLRLLEWRAWVHRRQRPVGATLGRWDALRLQDDFVALASWALYGANSAAPQSPSAARAVCGQAIRAPLQTTTTTGSWPARTKSCDDTEEPRWKP